MAASHNMRPTELNGLLGMSQLSRLDSNIEKRKSLFDIYISEIDQDKF